MQVFEANKHPVEQKSHQHCIANGLSIYLVYPYVSDIKPSVRFKLSTFIGLNNLNSQTYLPASIININFKSPYKMNKIWSSFKPSPS